MSTWPEVEDYLRRSQLILIPIGSSEQHGPNGLLGTDFLCPELIAFEAQRTADLLVAPSFNVGMAQHHLHFPGTIALRPTTMIAALFDWVSSFAGHGFERLYFLNGHGGNVASIEAAFSEIYSGFNYRRAPPGVTLRLRNWWQLAGVRELSSRLFPDGYSGHASPAEVAITQWGFPEHIKSTEMYPRIAPTGPIRDAVDFRRRFPDGRLGTDPSQATPEAGGELVRQAAVALIKELAEGW